jgi:hypothetical protein
MSGRRISSPDGSPAGTSTASWPSSSGSGGGRSAGSGWPDQELQRVLVERALPRRLGQRGARAFEQRLRLAEVQLGGSAVLEAKARDPGRFLARGQRLPVTESCSSSASRVR